MSSAATGPASGVAPVARVRMSWAFTLLEAVLWIWSILVCVPYWMHMDDYAYGWFVPIGMFLFLWMRLGGQKREFWEECGREGRATWRVSPWLIALAGLGLFPIEVYREEYHQSGLVLWGINMAKVAFSMAGAWWLGGRKLLGLTLFPLLFFLTAVPWPAKIAHPLQQNLMIGIANVIAEILLWLDVPVQLQGAVLNLTNGTVGIVEACSGIRSLQSGLMVSLAVGELMWLTRGGRALLVVTGIGLALLSNLARTFTLCWIVEKSGSAAMNAKHDLVGNVAMYSLYALIFAAGAWLGRGRQGLWPRKDAGTWGERISLLSWEHVPDFRPLLAVTVTVFLTVHGWYKVLEIRAKPQGAPAFTAILEAGSGNEKRPFSDAVWGQLGANEGDSIVRSQRSAPMGEVYGSHLFWKPSAMSRTALHHRPDVCMPGSGWKMEGDPTETTVEISGQKLRFFVFKFQREELGGKMVSAITLWGVWRNGVEVPFDFTTSAALPEKYGFLPTDRHMRAIELIAAMVPYEKGEPPLEAAREALAAMFQYKPYQPGR